MNIKFKSVIGKIRVQIEHAKRLVYEILNSRDDSGGGGSRYDGGMGMGGGIGSAKGEVNCHEMWYKRKIILSMSYKIITF